MDPANPLGELGRFLLLAGIVLAVVGLLLVAGGRLPFRLGRLPGDLAYQGRHGGFYFPIVTCIVLSLALSMVMWIINYFRR